MKKITHISTTHKELGCCNSDRLCDIIAEINPEVVFLEALENTYSDYSKSNFENYGIFHQKLEINALQKYSKLQDFIYIPVLQNEMPRTFDDKYEIVTKNLEFKNILYHFYLQVEKYGFEFLNSRYCMQLHQDMRNLEKHILRFDDIGLKVNEIIDSYENEMLDNIYHYCTNNDFTTAIFMCGSGHRNSIMEKVGNHLLNNIDEFHWKFLEF